ncbi:uncharacterized protein LOC111268274 [Varroa jacobsoni]|uniref:Uncharacterized protein n=1 Tax=Varroa destructor TaxID=109461 RepID=A0A7M7KDW7_VARDE|nr:uncharacterized protein LOC111251730 [Varroa destructor]XP_022664369.1 uncharacterized protein LOC111251730 [Varroa destructor]XP_022664370.1 uncharacterized protein LOC111251730 [Varroa destructor]XP_022664371.1 uncharacterized protein LOC111251730 [Varroa destructor]XP_022664372.1 uncharacterized protein LOC111251730 [Varroa destructor]XP_022702901.1 uncharacterized protein LOC111268274 [Varroa jacobsoni]XP_022702902.1 uncharacterized protein LOC111268274 [Varroa jacobsoni]XP_022702903.
MGLNMSSDSILLSRISYRHSRVGNLPYIVYFSGCLATLACSLLIAGAIMMAIVFTEVRPPTDDENYQRYIGADFRRVIGPLMMVMASLMLLLGCGVTLLGYTSAQTDRKEIQKYVDAEMQSLPVHQSGYPYTK